jgi:hypothetical protein
MEDDFSHGSLSCQPGRLYSSFKEAMSLILGKLRNIVGLAYRKLIGSFYFY